MQASPSSAGLRRLSVLEQRTTAAGGRSIKVGRHERRLAEARERQGAPEWIADSSATRPKVERKIAHLMRRRHGGRHARVRGRTKIAAEFARLAAAVNLARLGVTARPGGCWGGCPQPRQQDHLSPPGTATDPQRLETGRHSPTSPSIPRKTP